MFCHITRNWRGKPLLSHEVIIQLIAATTTKEGLRIQAQLDTSPISPGIGVPYKDMDKLNIQHGDFHGE
jgi:hypothetical protein